MYGLTIAFDLDGTLVDTAPDLVGATNHVLADLGRGPLDGALVRPWISYGARRMIVEAATHAGLAPDENEILRQLDRFLEYYAANIARESRPFDGVAAALDELAVRGATLAVCTNKREDLARSLLGELGLLPRFKAIAGRDTFAYSKPDPRHLTGAVALAGGTAERAVMVGDSGVDIETAKAGGIPVVAVTFGYTETPVTDFAPDAVIDHYDALVAAVTAIVDARRPPSGA